MGGLVWVPAPSRSLEQYSLYLYSTYTNDMYFLCTGLPNDYKTIRSQLYTCRIRYILGAVLNT